MQGDKQDFVGLTTLRAIGALCVVEHHTWFYVYPAWSIHWFVPGFILWPDYFFVLSGFILTHVYGKSLREARGRDVYNYLVHRVARVWPLHAFMLFVLVAFEGLRLWISHYSSADMVHPIFAASTDPKYILSNLFLVQAWHIHHINSWNDPAWSVSAEFACYLVFPWILKYGLAREARKAALLTLLAVCGLCWIQFTRHTFDVTYDYGVPRAFFSFSLGMVLYQFRPQLLHALRFIPPTLLQLGVIAGVIVAYIVNARGLFFIPLWVLLVAVLTYEHTLVARFLSWGPFVKLGDMSYSLYMVHILILWSLLLVRVLAPAPFAWFTGLPHLVVLGTIFAAVIGLSSLTYRYVENPGRRYIRRHFDRRTRPPAAVVAAGQPG